MLKKFLRLYDLQRRAMTFDTPEAFLRELELYDLTQQSMHDYLKVIAAGVWLPNLAYCLLLQDTRSAS